jgi:N-acetylglucosamine transport system permease protein
MIVLYPVFWTITTSFKSTKEFYASPFSLPNQWILTNYINAFEKSGILGYFMNSIYVSIVSVILCNFVGFISAYALARFRFIFSSLVLNIYLYGLFIPAVVSIVPIFMLLNSLQLIDTRSALVIVYSAISLPFTIFLLRGFLLSIPKDYEESALIDGCSYYGILFRIIAPMALPSIVTVTIFNFMGFWNEYILAVSIISTESKRTITLGLAYLMEVQRYATDWGALFAALVVAMIPVIIVYIILQRKITSGLTVGGIKG